MNDQKQSAPLLFEPGVVFEGEMTEPQATICTRITLRDLFAGLALAGLSGQSYEWHAAASNAYRYADAMLAERGRHR